MKAVKTMMSAAVVVLVTSSVALAAQPEGSAMENKIEEKFGEMIGNLQASVGLDFLSREGFYVVAAMAVVLVLFLFSKVAGAARDADELAKQRRVVKARKRVEAEYEAAEEKRQKRRYGS
jgi:hypothetical protein